MATILCPTRGGEKSIPNQDRAISIAKERGADLIFLYVSDVHFLDHLASPILVDLEAELDEMGEFLCTMALERADKAGVRAQIMVRRGIFRQALKEVIQEHGVTTVVMGSPAEEGGITTPEYISGLVGWIVAETGAEVIVTDGSEIVRQSAP